MSTAAMLLSFTALIAAVVVSLYARSSNKKNAQEFEVRAEELRAESAARVRELAELRQEVTEAADQFKTSAQSTPRTWSNLNRRTQAVRLLRTGENAQRIAEQLEMGRGEVELLHKVQSILASAYDEEKIESGSNILVRR